MYQVQRNETVAEFETMTGAIASATFCSEWGYVEVFDPSMGIVVAAFENGEEIFTS